VDDLPVDTGARMPLNIDLIIFDCDGVLVDSEPIINRAHAETLRRHGYAVTAEILAERFTGFSDADMLSTIAREQGIPMPSDYEVCVNTLIDAYSETDLFVMPGTRDLLATLDMPICVASSGIPKRIRTSLRIVGLLDRFEPHLFSATMVARGKPAPDLFLHAARSMGTAPARCLVVEDSVAGVQAAISAGMTAIGFCGGKHCLPKHRDLLRQHGAIRTISDMGDLLPLIG
jgi:HAD superfamily hydrolase (TIGR01509 family)